MTVASMKQLLKAGVHFGHQTCHWSLKMKKYIFTEGNGIYIIDLQKTMRSVDTAYDYTRNVAEEGGTALFAGTKKQAQEAIRDEAICAGQYYVNHHRLGGTLTSWGTVQKYIVHLEKINTVEEDGTFEVLPKKEVAGLDKERERLEKSLGDIADIPRIPDVIYVVDPRKERIAAREAHKLGIPIVTMVDINCDPDEINVVTLSNDDAIRAMKLITAKMADVFIESNQEEDRATEELFVGEIPEVISIKEIVDVVEGNNESAE